MIQLLFCFSTYTLCKLSVGLFRLGHIPIEMSGEDKILMEVCLSTPTTGADLPNTSFKAISYMIYITSSAAWFNGPTRKDCSVIPHGIE